MSRRTDRKRDATKVRSYDEGGVSDKSQFNERSDRPVITKFLTQEEINKHKIALCESYDCDEKDIEAKFESITDEYGFDEDVADCVMLAYYWTFSDPDGIVKKRKVFNIKVPVPEEIKQRAREAKLKRAQLAGAAPTTEIAPRRARVRGQVV